MFGPTLDQVPRTHLIPNRPKSRPVAPPRDLNNFPDLAETNQPPAAATLARLQPVGIDIALIQETYLKPIGLKPAASQAMSNYERTGHTVVLLPTTSGQWSRRASRRFRHPRIAGSFRRYSRIDKQKRSFAPREYPTPSTDPERELSNAK
ncbi:hypothetical protein EVAR_41896_1 [Eumeta japonica]|uniref:Uncharacterized protein n=1 Tax=Eumeta variegata TaxID=151549 RepID=A0A4C1YM09_EUMVA|nr:hypothetical protein EVAR_41896_1 [Eumeta japonica]